MQRAGHFIVLEGIDGSGTTSQLEALAAILRARGHDVMTTREPSDGPAGMLARKHLDTRSRALDPHALALLFAADRLDHVRSVIAPALDTGRVVLCDRYVLSSFVYQALECDPTWVRAINVHAPWPDATFVLTLPVEVALQRIRARANQHGTAIERFDAGPVLQRVSDNYRAALNDPSLPGLVEIPASDVLANVTARLYEACARLRL